MTFSPAAGVHGWKSTAILPEMEHRARWDGDERMTGVRSADDATGPIQRLLDDMGGPGWVSEEPVAHLGPKLRAWLADQRADAWRLIALSVESDRLVVDVAWQGEGRIRDLRADAYALIGSFAEAMTNVVQRRDGEVVVFDVATGQPDGEFEAHGHLLVIRVRAAPSVGP